MTPALKPSPTDSADAGGPAANLPAYIALCCGLASFVPWVILLTLPMAFVLGLFGLLRSTRLPDKTGRTAAVMGMGIGLLAAVLQLALAGLAAAVGWIFG